MDRFRQKQTNAGTVSVYAQCVCTVYICSVYMQCVYALVVWTVRVVLCVCSLRTDQADVYRVYIECMHAPYSIRLRVLVSYSLSDRYEYGEYKTRKHSMQ